MFKLKEAITGIEPSRYKAKVMAQAYSQREEIDYTKVFSPVAKYTTIRIFLLVVTIFDLHLEQMDVITTFLHRGLKEIILMKQPNGFEVQSKKTHVCWIKRSLYALKQSPR